MDSINENPFAGAEFFTDPAQPSAPAASSHKRSHSTAKSPANPTAAAPQPAPDKPMDQIPPNGVITPRIPPGAPKGPDGKLIARAGKVPSHFVDPSSGSVVEIASKDRTFLRHYFELGQAGAEQNAHISSLRANHLLKLPAIQQYLREVMWKAGISDEKIALRIAEGLDAMVAPKEFLNKEGEVVEGTEHIDFEQRGKYIDRALRVQGIDKPEAAPSPYGPAGSASPSSGLLIGLKPEDVLLLVDALKERADKHGATEADVVPPSPSVPPPPPANGPTDSIK